MPLPPQPIIPRLTAELAALPKTVRGLRIDSEAAVAAVLFIKVRRLVSMITPGDYEFRMVNSELSYVKQKRIFTTEHAESTEKDNI